MDTLSRGCCIRREKECCGRGPGGRGPSWTVVTTLFVLSCLFVDYSSGIKWLSVGVGERRYWNKTKDCSRKKTPGLVKQQKQICRRNLELMPIVAEAARETMSVCQEKFKNSRWNCSSILLAPNLMPDLAGGSREQGFVYSLSSIALTSRIAKACATGTTAKCACGPHPTETPTGDWKWGGCGDDVRFGGIFARMFTDSPFLKKQKSKSSKMNLHNNQVGRHIVEKSLEKKCKCHGVSGSCTIQTCWRQVPETAVLSAVLQKAYSTAIEFTTKRVKKERRIVPLLRHSRSISGTDIIYYTKSPDYCLPDKQLGSFGTKDRKCDKNEPSSGGCQSMCCGRGFNTEIITIKQRCECKYYWCCYVKCKTCMKQVEINKCR